MMLFLGMLLYGVILIVLTSRNEDLTERVKKLEADRNEGGVD